MIIRLLVKTVWKKKRLPTIDAFSAHMAGSVKGLDATTLFFKAGDVVGQL